MSRSDDRPFLDRFADLCDEESHPQSIWPTFGRRRHPQNEWDDYVVLYGFSTDDSDITHEAYRLHAEPEEHRCTLCGHTSPTARGLSVHLSRRHDIRSARADYFASRKEPQ